MDLITLKTEIENFKEDVKNFIITVNSNSSTSLHQETIDLSLTIQKLSNVCEACHNALSLLSSTESFNGNSHMAIELWNLTRAFEYTKRKHEILAFTQKWRKIGNV